MFHTLEDDGPKCFIPLLRNPGNVSYPGTKHSNRVCRLKNEPPLTIQFLILVSCSERGTSAVENLSPPHYWDIMQSYFGQCENSQQIFHHHKTVDNLPFVSSWSWPSVSFVVLFWSSSSCPGYIYIYPPGYFPREKGTSLKLSVFFSLLYLLCLRLTY